MFRWITIACMTVALFAIYTQAKALKAERNEAQQRAGALQETVNTQKGTIDALREDRQRIDKLMCEWRETREAISQTRQVKKQATQKARKTDATFRSWADVPLPAVVRTGGLLGKKRPGAPNGNNLPGPAGSAD